MQTNYNFIKQGVDYPPISEAERIKDYRDNLLLYNGRMEEVFHWYKSRLQVWNGEKILDTFYVDLNYFRLVTSKTADLVCGELPDLSFNEGTTEEEQDLVTECADIINKRLRTGVIDYSRFGETVFRVYKGEDGQPKVVVMSPIMLVPVVSDEDIGEIKSYVIAFPEAVNEAKGEYIMHLQIHEKGRYISRKYSASRKENKINAHNLGSLGQTVTYATYTLLRQLEDDVVTVTGIDDFAIYHIVNEPTSDNIHGTSDYMMFASIVAEMGVRHAQIARILDKHADPNIAAPMENIDMENGKFVGMRTGGKVWMIGDDGKIPQYITWDGQLEAAYKEIDRLSNELDKLTEMGSVISDNTEGGGSQGYEALQVKMTNARLKARRISEALNEPYKKMIGAAYQIMTGRPLKTEFSVSWNDGLPSDALRDAQIAQMEVSTGRKSKLRVRMEYDGMTKEEAIAEQTQIDSEMPANTVESIFT